MNSIIADFKVGARQFMKAPGSMALAIVAYAVGLGLVGLMLTLIFGVVRAHPPGIDFETVQVLNWDDSTRHLWKNGAQLPQLRYRDFRELHEEQDVFDALAASRGATFNIVLGKHAERFDGSYVTADYFKTLDVRPVIGHMFLPGDDSPKAQAKAVISHRLWQNQFDGQESIIGRSLNVNGVATTVIGVAAEGFDFPSKNDIWVAETLDPLSIGRAEGMPYMVSGVLKRQFTPAAALPSLNTIAKRFAEAYPDTNTGYIAFELAPLSSIFLGDQFELMMYLMLACACLVLLIACTNVANLTLARTTGRIKELAIRSALGGRRIRLIAQMIVEGFTVAIVGGVGGLIIAIWTSKFIWAWANEGDVNNIPTWMNMDVDLQVIAVLSIATLLASVTASIVPALQASRADVNEILKDNSRGSTGLKIGMFSKLLTLFQLCVSCGLLIATSALVSTAKQSAVFEPPYDPAGMMVGRFDLPEAKFPEATRAETLFQLQQTLENNPALEGVGFTTSIDMLMNWPSRWDVRGLEMVEDADYINARQEIVSDNYFELLGIPILYGRGFESIDRSSDAEQVCVINEILAEKLWPGPGNSAIGKQIRDVWSTSHPWLTIVGVVPDTKMAGPGARPSEQLGGVYRPMSAAPQASVTVFSKTTGDPLVQAQHIRAALHALDESIVLYRIKTVEKAVEESNFGPLFYRNMFGMFGLAALALASIGVYGVMNFSVRQRFQEFGIRQALGALHRNIISQVFRMGAVQVSVGLALGIFLGWGLITVIGQGLGGAMSLSILNYLVPISVLVGIAILALYLPARYATRANLANSLRDEQ